MTKTLVGTPDPDESRDEFEQQALDAFATLTHLMENSDPGVRLKAATEILDRARTKVGEYVLTQTAATTDSWRVLQGLNEDPAPEEPLVASSEEISPRASILREAEGLITGDRNVSYGSPTQNFTNIADLWTTQFQHLLKDDAKFEPWHVADALIHLKLARNISQNKRDNYVDLAGYAACGYETTLGE